MNKIIFGEIGRKKELEGIKLIDMHNHSTFSDGDNKPEEIISRAKELNIGVCITDHNEIKGSLQICKEVLSIPSTELTSSDSHDFLAYFNSEKDATEFFKKKIEGKKLKTGLFKMWKLNIPNAEMIDILKDYNALIALPHPFTHRPKNSYKYFEKNKNLGVLKKIDAIEGINGMLRPGRNKKAIEWASLINKPIIGGTDSHNMKYLGNIVTGCFAETRTEFIEEIRKGNNYVIVRNEIGFVSRGFAGLNILKNNISLFGK